MILSDLLELTVVDDLGQRVGTLVDARLVVDGTPHQGLAEARLDGFIVSPHSRHSYLGYERSNMRAPAIINAILAWMHRGTFYVRWEAVEGITGSEVRLRAGYQRFDPRLPGAPVTGP